MFTPKQPTIDYKFLYEILLRSYNNLVEQYKTLGEYIKQQKEKEIK